MYANYFTRRASVFESLALMAFSICDELAALVSLGPV